MNSNDNRLPPTMISESRSEASAVQGIKATVHDVFELVELHVRLFRSDLRQLKSAAGGTLVLMIGAAAIGVCSLAVLLLGLAFYLAQVTPLDQASAMLLCGGGMTILALLIAWWSARAIARSLATFDASLQELGRTIRWLQNQFPR